MHNIPQIIMSVDAGIPEQPVKIVLNAFDDHMRIDGEDRNEWRSNITK